MPPKYGSKQLERKGRLRRTRKASQEVAKEGIRQSLQLTFDRDEMRELLQDSLDRFAIEVGRRVTVGFLEDEVEQLCGPRYQWRRDRTAGRAAMSAWAARRSESIAPGCARPSSSWTARRPCWRR